MVVLRDVPVWVPAAQGAWLRQAVAVQFTRDPLDRQGLERAKLVLAQCPWIETVDRVERRGEQVEVAAQYRQPGALVRVGEGYRLIDGHGVLLPGWYQPQRLPIIEGIAAPPPREGTVWPGAQLQAALVMIRVAAGQPWVSQVRAYDVGHTDALGRTRLVLWTGTGRDPARDPHVVWGLPPGQEASIEPNTANKLARLAAIQNDPRFHGWIDAEHRIVEVYGATMFKREPLPAVSDPAAPTRYTLLR